VIDEFPNIRSRHREIAFAGRIDAWWRASAAGDPVRA